MRKHPLSLITVPADALLLFCWHTHVLASVSIDTTTLVLCSSIALSIEQGEEWIDIECHYTSIQSLPRSRLLVCDPSEAHPHRISEQDKLLFPESMHSVDNIDAPTEDEYGRRQTDCHRRRERGNISSQSLVLLRRSSKLQRLKPFLELLLFHTFQESPSTVQLLTEARCRYLFYVLPSLLLTLFSTTYRYLLRFLCLLSSYLDVISITLFFLVKFPWNFQCLHFVYVYVEQVLLFLLSILIYNIFHSRININKVIFYILQHNSHWKPTRQLSIELNYLYRFQSQYVCLLWYQVLILNIRSNILIRDVLFCTFLYIAITSQLLLYT